MIVDVTTAAVSKRVAHLEVVKRDLSIADTSENEALLLAIDVVSAEFARIMGREPWMQSYVIRQPGDGGTSLRLPVWPLISVSQVRAGVTEPDVVEASEYEIAGDTHAGARRDTLYRKCGWARPYAFTHSGDDRPLNYETTCVAGWATPIDRWAAETPVRLGEYARPSSSHSPLRFEATDLAADGVTASSEPSWPSEAGGTVDDGDVTWTAREAIEMPFNLAAAAIWAVKTIHQRGDLLSAQIPGIKVMAGGGMRLEFTESTGTSGLMPKLSINIVEQYS